MNRGMALGLDVQVDGSARRLGRGTPARRGQLRGVVHHRVQVDQLAGLLGRRAGEPQQALDRLAAIQGCLCCREEQVVELRQVRRLLDQCLASQLAIARHQHQRLVQIVCDTTGHLAERTQLL